MTRPVTTPWVPHDRAELRTEPHERELSAAAKRFLIERDPYDFYVEPDEACEATCARVRARTGESA